eukprot:1187532-Prorocentrum_minimum.AAC.2
MLFREPFMHLISGVCHTVMWNTVGGSPSTSARGPLRRCDNEIPKYGKRKFHESGIPDGGQRQESHDENGFRPDKFSRQNHDRVRTTPRHICLTLLDKLRRCAPLPQLGTVEYILCYLAKAARRCTFHHVQYTRNVLACSTLFSPRVDYTYKMPTLLPCWRFSGQTFRNCFNL